MAYAIELTPRAQRQIRKLTRKAQRAVKAAIDALAEDPSPPGVERLEPKNTRLYRIRAGDYRIVYRIDKGRLAILVVLVGNRREVYRLLRRLKL